MLKMCNTHDENFVRWNERVSIEYSEKGRHMKVLNGRKGNKRAYIIIGERERKQVGE